MSLRPVNSTCPWSGKPVSPDSLTTYRGHQVGFCNPSCAQKFTRALDHFDCAIGQVQSDRVLPTESEAYGPRHYASSGIVAIGRSQLKSYCIDAYQSSWDTQASLAEARRYLQGFSNHDRLSVAEYGHLLIHRGTEALWLVANWWQSGGILCGHVARAADDGAFSPADTALLGCVWELRVVEHERRAWANHMMTDQPDTRAFLADRLPDGDY